MVMIASADEGPSFSFVLSIDGKDTKEVQTGDVITVTLRLKRLDEQKPYMMYAMQDEIRYDSTFFEYVEGSAVLSNGIVSTDIAMVDQYREFYMNFLSMTGGMEWAPDTLVGSFQLRVTGTSGVTQISNGDYLVSVKDGSESYPCEANELTIILSTECTVSFRSNGGSEIETQTVQFGEKVIKPEDPTREGFVFAGWYKDIHLSEEWDFENDVVRENMSLYAKWISADSVVDDSGSVGQSMNWLWWLLLLILILVLLYIMKKQQEKRKND